MGDRSSSMVGCAGRTKMRAFPPRVPLENLPEGEQDHGFFLSVSLLALDRLCIEFEAAVALFDFSQTPAAEQIKVGDRNAKWYWPFTAAHAAVSAVYQFMEAMESIKINLNKCPTILAKINVGDRRA